MRSITVDELTRRLADGEKPVVIDVRPEDAFEQWRIPGARNVPVIDDLRRNDPRSLIERAEQLPDERPLIMVCNVGVSSARAVHALSQMGIAAINLEGGMRAWSLAHTEAPINMESNAGARCIQIRRNGKGCLSYFVGSDGEAMVVDPCVRADVYRRIAERENLRIVRIAETHVHADHVSRAAALAKSIGLPLHLPRNDRVRFEYEALDHGDSFKVGAISIRAMHTPGHTGESMCYLLNDEILLSGDTLFVDGVGRPDLEKGDAGAETGAQHLYNSLHQQLLTLGDSTLVCPAHTTPDAIDFTGRPVCATLGQARSRSPLLNGLDISSFVREIVSRIGAKPPSFQTVIAVNEGRLDLAGRDPVDLEAGPNRCAVH